MTRVLRTRPDINIVTGSPGYRQWWLGATQIGGNVYNNTYISRSKMSDSVGPLDEDGPLYVLKSRVVNDARLSGQFISGTVKDVYINFGMDAGALERLESKFLTWAPAIDWNNLALRARASINPSTPAVDLPVFLAELRDIPKIYQETMRQYILYSSKRGSTGGASANLMVQFGVLPVVDDIIKMFSFAKAVKNREEHLRRLAGGARFSRKLDNYLFDVDMGNTIMWTTRVANIKTLPILLVSGRRKSWFTCRASAVIPDAGEIPSMAWDLTLGLRGLSVKQFYELIPWSWLIDYFTNVGSILAAYRNDIEFTMGPPTIMVMDSLTQAQMTPDAWIHGTSVPAPPPVIDIVRKQRQVVTPNLFKYFRHPYLTLNQVSILASLLVVRHKWIG
jgi:hypothetical protein